MLLALAIAIGLMSGPQPSQSVAAFAEEGAVYVLREIDGILFEAEASITFEGGQARGRAPCNTWSGQLAVPYPWFEMGPLRVTRAICPEMAEERRFFEALEAMTLAEVAGPVLILSDERGRKMVFRSD